MSLMLLCWCSCAVDFAAQKSCSLVSGSSLLSRLV